MNSIRTARQHFVTDTTFNNFGERHFNFSASSLGIDPHMLGYYRSPQLRRL